MTWKAQNEVRAWNGMPARVRLSEWLGCSLWRRQMHDGCEPTPAQTFGLAAMDELGGGRNCICLLRWPRQRRYLKLPRSPSLFCLSPPSRPNAPTPAVSTSSHKRLTSATVAACGGNLVNRLRGAARPREARSLTDFHWLLRAALPVGRRERSHWNRHRS